VLLLVLVFVENYAIFCYTFFLVTAASSKVITAGHTPYVFPRILMRRIRICSQNSATR